MNGMVIALGWVGLFAPMALGAVGSIIGCSIAGQAAIGAMLETESGHGRYVGLSAMPSSQIIYGIVVMLTLNREITVSEAPGLFGIGVLAGLALMISSIRQGLLVASAINAIKAKPELFGLSLAPAAVAEGFAVFAFIFALVLIGGLPTG
jgi:V/A-type H+-transporting ATPase subunit K